MWDAVGGRTVGALAALAPEGKVVGLDYSAASVAVSRKWNAREIAAGRVQIEQGSVAALPFPDGTFDVVTAVETHYYWPDLPANVREIGRVLKPGGSFMLIAETYRGGPLRWLYGIVMPLLRAAFLSDAEHRELLTQAGFTEVTTEHVPGKNWICAKGRAGRDSGAMRVKRGWDTLAECACLRPIRSTSNCWSVTAQRFKRSHWRREKRFSKRLRKPANSSTRYTPSPTTSRSRNDRATHSSSLPRMPIG